MSTSYALHQACEEGDMGKVRALIKKRYDVNEFDGKHWTPLHCAASGRHLDVCKYLLKSGASPKHSTSNNATALHYIARMREHALLPTVLKALVDKGADVNQPNYSGTTPLMEACLRGSFVCAQFMIDNGAQIQCSNNFGETPLHQAVRSTNMDVVALLMQSGADVAAASKDGTPLEIAERVLSPSKLERFKGLIERHSAVTDQSAMRTMHNYESLPAEVQKMAQQAKISPQKVNQHFDLFMALARKSGADKYLDPEPEEEPMFLDEDPRPLFKVMGSSGSGGYGTVYSAKNVKTKQLVAIKKIAHKTKAERRANENEVRLLRKAQCKNVVSFIAAYLLPGGEEAWLVMENMMGGSLKRALQKAALHEAQIAYIIRNLLEALDVLHDKHIIHRDLKGANIMMTVKGDVKLVDFGLAFDSSRGGKLAMAGSPFWIAPEVLRREPISTAVDIWSLGMVALEMANRSPPNSDNKLKAMFAIATGEMFGFADASQWSREFAHFVGECLKATASERPTVKQLLKHRWLSAAASREQVIDMISRIFLSETVDKLGF